MASISFAVEAEAMECDAMVAAELAATAVMTKTDSAMSASDAYNAVARSTGLKPGDVKHAVEGMFALAAKQVKKYGSFNMAGMLNLKLKAVRFRRKPASKTVKAITMKKLKNLVN